MTMKELWAASAAALVCALFMTPASAVAGHDIIDDLHDAYASADGDAVAALYADDAVLISDAFPFPLVGRASIGAGESLLFGSFCNPDWDATDVVRHSKRYAVQYTLTVDFCGPFPGPDGKLLMPTGERVSLDVATFITLEKGKIVHERRYANLAAMYDQLAP